MASAGKTAAAAEPGLKKYLSDPASALTDAAGHMKAAISDTPVQPFAKQLADAAGQPDEGLVMVGVVALGLLIGLFIIGAVNIVTGVGFVVPAYSTLQTMQGSNAEKDIMAKMVPVYWIVFSGLLVFEQFGLLPIFIGNVLYAVIKGLALFWMWEMNGTTTVFGLVKPFVDTKTA